MGASNRKRGMRNGYRSGLEDRISSELNESGVTFGYETIKIEYRVEETRKYTPDFIFPNGVIVETKGRFTTEDRKKHLLIKQQHPELDIRFVFSNSKNKIRKGSPTSYGDWCKKHGFVFSEKTIPKEWLE